MKQDDLREGARRQHRKIALFCILYCHFKNIDGISISKKLLKDLLGIKRIASERVDWLKEDLGEFFSKDRFCVDISEQEYVFIYVNDNRRSEPLTLSKYSFNEFKRSFGRFSLANTNLHEVYISFYLTLLSQGQISPKDLITM